MHDLTSGGAGVEGAGDGASYEEPARTREQEALLSLLRSVDLAKHRLSGLFGSEGITFQQYNVLRILRRSGAKGLPTLEVGERMIERTPGVTRIIDRLEAKGLVARERCTQDRRRVWCRISSEGLDLLERLDGPVSRSDVAIFQDMTPDELDGFIGVLERLHTRLSSLEQGSGGNPAGLPGIS
jgi:DNA-binding MarR family transcriptional regulator